jgi:Ca-activated chloride channel family protein
LKLTHVWLLHFLWLLPLAGVALAVCGRQKKKAMERFADPELLARLTGQDLKRRRFFKGLFLLTALALMLFALAGPRWGSHYQEVSQKGVDIMILVDVSASMGVEDIKPDRLERARREILDFLSVVQGDRVGLVAFSGAAFVQCPLTLDYGAVEMFLGQLEPDLIPVPGTDLGAAIETGLSSFDFKEETDKVILLITDGEDNEGKGLDAARKAAEKGVKVFVFGMGETSGGPIPAGDGKGGFKKDKEGKLILSRLEEESLRRIASATGGTYARSVAGDLDLDILYFDGIKSRTEAQTLKSGKIKVYEERFPIFLLAALVFLVLENLLPERSVRVRPS